MTENYSVNIEAFAQRHFIKNFEKKYNQHWDITLNAVISQLERVDMLLLRDIADIIISAENIKIIKTCFSVAGTKKSPKNSGNRCIAVVDENIRNVYILLVYHKNHLGGGNETAKWKQMIKDNYAEYKKLFR